MANNYTKTMRDALNEARSFRDVQEGFSTAQIKMAYGVLNDPRYKQGNYDGAAKAIEKIVAQRIFDRMYPGGYPYPVGYGYYPYYFPYAPDILSLIHI